MITANEFISKAKEEGFDFYTGVPCSLLTSLIDHVIAMRAVEYIGATSEGEACGIAAGAWLAGRLPVVILQNSGLGNTINPLTSLNHPFRIPSLMLVTWRGEPNTVDEPQHQLMGQITHRLLDAAGIAHAPLPDTAGELPAVLAQARLHMSVTGLPFALVVRKGQFGAAAAPPPPSAQVPPLASVVADEFAGAPMEPRSTRFETMGALVGVLPESAAVIATTGKTGRELFTLGDRDQQFYLVGSMGCASAVALGVAVNADRPVVVFDGDGAALMKLGNLATIGVEKPGNLIHVVLDNGVHDSTGGQATASASIDFARMAAAAGYRTAARCVSLSCLRGTMARALAAPGPHFIHARITKGSLESLGRPTIAPDAVARRFRRFLTGEAPPDLISVLTAAE